MVEEAITKDHSMVLQYSFENVTKLSKILFQIKNILIKPFKGKCINTKIVSSSHFVYIVLRILLITLKKIGGI